MNSAPNKRRWIVPAAWLATAVAAFSFGRMSSWLEEPLPPALGTAGAAGAGSADGAGGPGGAGGHRVGTAVTADSEQRPVLTIGQVTGGQPLDDWLKKLLAQDDDIYRMQNFVKLFDALNSPEDIKAALKIIAESGRGGRGRNGMRFTEYSMLLQKLTQMDAKGAIEFANQGEGGERFMATGTVLRTWAKSEPDAALAWAKENGMPQNQGGQEGQEGRGPNDNWALASVVTQLAKTNLDKALQEAASMEAGRTSGRTAEALVAEAVEQRGIDDAMKLAEGLPAGQFQRDFIAQLADRLGNADPQKGSVWASNLPAGELRREALSNVVDEWLGKNQADALVFVQKLPVGPDSDGARMEAAQRLGRTNPDLALQTIQNISDPQQQMRAVGRIAGDLYRRDQNAGQQFLMSSPLAEEMKAQMLNQFALQQQQQQRGGGDFRGFRGGGFGPRPN